MPDNAKLEELLRKGYSETIARDRVIREICDLVNTMKEKGYLRDGGIKEQKRLLKVVRDAEANLERQSFVN